MTGNFGSYFSLEVESYLNVGILQFLLNFPVSFGDHNWKGLATHPWRWHFKESGSVCNPCQKERARKTLESRFLILPVGCWPPYWLIFLILCYFVKVFREEFWTDYAYLTYRKTTLCKSKLFFLEATCHLDPLVKTLIWIKKKKYKKTYSEA